MVRWRACVRVSSMLFIVTFSDGRCGMLELPIIPFAAEQSASVWKQMQLIRIQLLRRFHYFSQTYLEVAGVQVLRSFRCNRWNYTIASALGGIDGQLKWTASERGRRRRLFRVLSLCGDSDIFPPRSDETVLLTPDGGQRPITLHSPFFINERSINIKLIA